MLRPMDSLTCPECRQAGIGGAARIGNRRRACGYCNRFASRVRNRLNAKVRESVDPEALAQMRESIEREVYDEFVKEAV